MQDQYLNTIRIRLILYIIKKHKRKILTIFLATVLTFGIGSLIKTPTYRGSAQLLIKPGREDVYVSPTAASPVVVNESYTGERIKAEKVILTSLDLIRDSVERFGVDRLFDYPTRRERLYRAKNKILALIRDSVERFRVDRLFDYPIRRERFYRAKNKILTWIESMSYPVGVNSSLKTNSGSTIPESEKVYKTVMDSLEVSSDSRSNVISIAYDWPDPVIAADFVNILVELYLDKHLEVHSDPETYNLLNAEAQKWEAALNESEADLENFKRRHSIASLSQQKRIVLERISELDSQQNQTEAEIRATLAKKRALKSWLLELDGNGQVGETNKRSSRTLTELKARLLELELQGLKEEIEHVKKMIAVEEKSPLRQDLESGLLQAMTNLKALGARKYNYENQMVRYREELQQLDGLEKQWNELQRKAAINESNYKLYLGKFEEARIAASMDRQKISNVAVIERAVPVMEAVKPRKLLSILVGCFLGLSVGICVVFFSELISPVFRTYEDVQLFLDLPVLAAIPIEGRLRSRR
jgi:uncharacterized protein involved in exopolysaccharide biosynthesis